MRYVTVKGQYLIHIVDLSLRRSLLASVPGRICICRQRRCSSQTIRCLCTAPWLALCISLTHLHRNNCMHTAIQINLFMHAKWEFDRINARRLHHLQLERRTDGCTHSRAKCLLVCGVPGKHTHTVAFFDLHPRCSAMECAAYARAAPRLIEMQPLLRWRLLHSRRPAGHTDN